MIAAVADPDPVAVAVVWCWETCPMMHIFSALQDFYRTLSDLPHADRGDPEDANSDGEDHLPDCARYMLINLGGGAESWIRWARKQAIAAGALVDGANEETPHCELAAAGARGRRPGRGHYPQAQPRRDVPGERLQAVLREHSRSAGSDQAACVLAAGSKRSQPSQPSGLLGSMGPPRPLAVRLRWARCRGTQSCPGEAQSRWRRSWSGSGRPAEPCDEGRSPGGSKRPCLQLRRLLRGRASQKAEAGVTVERAARLQPGGPFTAFQFPSSHRQATGFWISGPDRR